MNKYLFFLSLQKTELNTMLHCIQIFTNTCEVTMQLKCYIGKALLHYRQTTNILPIHVLVLIKSPHYFAQLPVYVVCFPNVIKTLLHGFDPHIYILPVLQIFPCSYLVPVLIPMQQHSIHADLPFIGVERREIYEECSAVRQINVWKWNYISDILMHVLAVMYHISICDIFIFS